MSRTQEEDGPFRRREVCSTIHVRVDERLKKHEDNITSINRKIDATMIFALVTLVGIVILLVRGSF